MEKIKTPTGRLKVSEEFKKLLNESTVEALKVLKKIMLDNKARNFDRIQAAKYILDKGLGINFALLDSEVEEEEKEITVRIKKAKRNEDAE